MDFLDALSIIFLVTGTFFNFVGVVGIIRLPDAFTRLHASGKVATLGIISYFIAGMALEPSNIPKLIVLSLFIVLSAPVASHAIAAAANRRSALARAINEQRGPATGDSTGR